MTAAFPPYRKKRRKDEEKYSVFSEICVFPVSFCHCGFFSSFALYPVWQEETTAFSTAFVCLMLFCAAIAAGSGAAGYCLYRKNMKKTALFYYALFFFLHLEFWLDRLF